METINTLELTEESVYPSEDVLKSILGRSYAVYCDLLKLYDDNELNYEWWYYKDGKACLCKVQRKRDSQIITNFDEFHELKKIFTKLF